MVEMTLEAWDAAQWSRPFRIAPQVVENELRRTTHEATALLHREVVARTPRSAGEGPHLQDGIKARVTGHGLERRGQVFVTGFPYAGYVEFGTRPHMIFPRRKKALRFTAGGRTVFARAVRHPGTRGAHMFSRGLAASAGPVRHMFTLALRRATARIARG